MFVCLSYGESLMVTCIAEYVSVFWILKVFIDEKFFAFGREREKEKSVKTTKITIDAM